MYLEERLEALEKENRQLKERVEKMEKYSMTRFATPKEVAELMGCTIQNVHRKIKAGEIIVTRRLGDPRIPMYQFLEEPERKVLEMPKRSSGELSMAEKIFGKGG